MKDNIYQSTKISTSENIKIDYANNPKVAKKIGGIKTCRSSPSWHPIPSTDKNSNACQFL